MNTTKTATAGSDDGDDQLTYGDGWLDSITRLRFSAGHGPLNANVAKAIKRAANEGDARRAEQAVWMSALGVGRPLGPLTVRQLLGELLKVPADALDMPVLIELEGDGGGELDSLEAMTVHSDAEHDETTGEVISLRTVLRARRQRR